MVIIAKSLITLCILWLLPGFTAFGPSKICSLCPWNQLKLVSSSSIFKSGRNDLQPRHRATHSAATHSQLSLHKHFALPASSVHSVTATAPIDASPSSTRTATTADLDFERQRSAMKPPPAIRNFGLHIKIKGKVFNVWGLIYAGTTLLTATTLFPLMIVFSKLADLSGNGKRRRLLDWVIHVWARVTMTLTTSRVAVYGAEHLPPRNETVVYVPNHTSYFDIPLLSGYIPRPFKYLSKAEIMNIPLLGLGMKLAKHVFLLRNDPASTREVHETCIRRLRDGNSMLLFPEGRRSPDGALHKFKKGAFQIAQSAGVRVVPVSISNMHYWTPAATSLLPIAPIRCTYVRIHPPVPTANRTVREIKQECFEAVNGGLPSYQQYHARPVTGARRSGAAVVDGGAETDSLPVV